MANQPNTKEFVIPAQAGIQMTKISPRKWDNIKVLTAAQDFYDWIPACAGMTT